MGLSLSTTRRPDAFKIAVTLAALGRTDLGRLVDTCHDLAHHVAATVDAHPRLELHTAPVLTTAVFRYLPASGDPADTDRFNAALRRRLLTEGRAVAGRTELPGRGLGRVQLKVTVLNPQSSSAKVDAVLAAVVTTGEAEEAGGVGSAGVGAPGNRERSSTGCPCSPGPRCRPRRRCQWCPLRSAHGDRRAPPRGRQTWTRAWTRTAMRRASGGRRQRATASGAA
ncbi:hypothetical protein GCM10018779_33600 [Streptomyces griseocarneus]|nr:hypothetical protein GCM10018779_33600 [Streptomyces griseocarneus]